MRQIFMVLCSVALCATSHVPASADMVQDCYKTTLEQPRSNDRIIQICTRAINATGGTSRAAALHSRSHGYMYKGELDRALADLDESVKLNPTDLWARSSRANIYRMKGSYDRALSELNEIIRRDPKSIGAHADRGVLYKERGDVQSARADFQAVMGMTDKNADIERWAKGVARKNLDEIGQR